MRYAALKVWFKNLLVKAAAALSRHQGHLRMCHCKTLEMAELRYEKLLKCYDTRSEEYYALRHRLYELPGAPGNIIGTLAPIMSQTLAELRDRCTFDVRRSEDGDWEIVTQYCSLGGCDMGIIQQFPTERDALIFGAILAAVGYKIDIHTACSECYAEYMKDCI